MTTLRDIRRRITSVRSTMQITNAMKMVSTAKLNRAQNAVRSAQPYAQALRRMVISIAGGLTGEDHPFFESRDGGKTVVILFTSDRGLCGAFNANLNKALLAALNRGEPMAEPELAVFGRKGNEFFRRRGFVISKVVVQAGEAERVRQLRETIGEVAARFADGEAGRVFLAYNHFKSAINQEPRIVQLLPVVPPDEAQQGEAHQGEAQQEQARQGDARDGREPLFEPSRALVLAQLLPNYLENQLFLAHLNTEAGEHGARMVAMDGATRNAGEMITRLTLQANKARQAAITTELIEIVSGAEAL